VIRAALLLVILLAGGPPVVRPVVPAKQRMGKSILLVVDVSGSMQGQPFSRMMSAVRMIAGQPIDDASISVLAFEGRVWRWKYKGKTWVKLPDADALKAVDAWLSTRGALGTTRVTPALKIALREKRRDLS